MTKNVRDQAGDWNGGVHRCVELRVEAPGELMGKGSIMRPPNEVRAHIRRILHQLSKRSDRPEQELDVQPKVHRAPEEHGLTEDWLDGNPGGG